MTTNENENKPETKRNALSRFFGNDFLLSFLIAIGLVLTVMFTIGVVNSITIGAIKAIATLAAVIAGYFTLAVVVHAIRHAWARFSKKEVTQ